MTSEPLKRPPEHPPGEADPTGTAPVPPPGESPGGDGIAPHANVEVESGPVNRENREDPSPELP